MRKAEVLLVVVAILAGCMSDAPDVDAAVAEDSNVPADAPRAADGTLLHVARIPDAESTDVAMWANGTFSAQDASRAHDLLPGAGVTGSEGLILHDITSMVPRGVPVRIFAEVTSEMAQGDLDLFLNVPQGEWRTGNFFAPYGGASSFEVGVVHVSTEPIEVGLAYDVAEPAAEVPYTLMVRVIADPELLVNGIVAGVTLPADARLDVELLGETRTNGPEVEDVALMLYGPDDAFLGRFPLEGGTTSLALPAGSPAGEYVALLSQGGRNARLLVQGEPAAMRPLGLEWVNGEPVALDAQGRGSWTADYDRAPILVGVWFTSPNVARNVAFSVAGPEGPLFGASVASDVPWFSVALPDGSGFSNGWGWDSLYGPPGLVAGTYTHEVAFETAGGAQPASAGSYAAFHAR